MNDFEQFANFVSNKKMKQVSKTIDTFLGLVS